MKEILSIFLIYYVGGLILGSSIAVFCVMTYRVWKDWRYNRPMTEAEQGEAYTLADELGLIPPPDSEPISAEQVTAYASRMHDDVLRGPHRSRRP